MTKKELQALLKKLFIRNGIEANHVSFYKGLAKKELKAYVNEHGGFTKGKVKQLSFDPKSIDVENIPADAYFFNAVLSDESINMNGYRILLSAWQDGFQKYFDDYEGNVYYQHNMDEPIGKTLSIQVDQSQLTSSGYVFDDLTQKRISRGLVTDVSTGHIPLEIKYINEETGEEITPDEFYDILWDMVDEMRDDRKTREEIKEAIAELRAKWIETHTKVQIVEYSFVSVGANTQAGANVKNNTIEILNNELPDDVVIEEDTPEEVAEESELQEDGEEEETEELETQPTTEETPTTDDPDPAENNLENEGETPKGSDEDTGDTPGNGEEPASAPAVETEENKLLNDATAKIETLEAELLAKDEEIKKLKADIDELMEFNTSKKKVVATNDVVTNTSIKSFAEVSSNLRKIMRK